MKLFSLIIVSALLADACSAQTYSFNNQIDPAPQIDAAIGSGDYGTVTSVIILEDGDLIYEGYFNGSDKKTLHNTRSVTKTITGMMVGAAISNDLLKLDDAAARFFPELAPFNAPDPRKLAITLEDLLTMSGPLECDDWNQFSRGNEERMYIVEDWSRFYWDLPIRGFPGWASPPDQLPHGRAFSYCTAGVQILGEVVERATGRRATEFAEEQLFSPLGIEEFEWQYNGKGQAHLGGGLLLRTEDLAKFGELQRLKGTVGGVELFSANWAEWSTTPHATIPNSPFEYGYLWWLMPYEVAGDTYTAAVMSGNGGNRVYVLPDHNLTVVYTSTDFNTSAMHQNAQAFFEAEIVSRLGVDQP